MQIEIEQKPNGATVGVYISAKQALLTDCELNKMGAAILNRAKRKLSEILASRAVPYACKGDVRHMIYWLAAATLTACVTY